MCSLLSKVTSVTLSFGAGLAVAVILAISIPNSDTSSNIASPCLFPCAYAETFVAMKSGQWEDPSTWQGGAVAPFPLVRQGDRIEIPNSIAVSLVQPKDVHNSGEIIVEGTLFLQEKLVNYKGGTIQVRHNGTINIDWPGTIENRGVLYNDGLVFKPMGYLLNYGFVNNTGDYSTGAFLADTENERNGTIVNYNNFGFSNGFNQGTILNHGRIWFERFGLNSGTINNTGILTVGEMELPLSNKGTINNLREGDLKINGLVTNEKKIGTIRNDGIINIQNALENNGKVINSATGTINNAGTIKNNNEMQNYGVINNSNSVDNAGELIVNIGSRLVNAAFIHNISAPRGAEGKIIVMADNKKSGNSGIVVNSGFIQ